MSLSGLRWWHVLLGVIVGLPALFALVVYLNHHTFRFRMTLEIEADGKVRTGSSIIEVTYSPGGYQTKRWPTDYRGVTPMVDLGPQGTVMAAFTRDGGVYRDRLIAIGRPADHLGRGFPKDIADLPIIAYRLPPDRLDASVGKVEVRLEQLPSLIWVPPGAHWRSADVVLPEEMPEMIGPSVRFVRLTLEPAPGATLITEIEPAPHWLVVMRRAFDRGARFRSDHFNFHPAKIETGYRPKMN